MYTEAFLSFCALGDMYNQEGDATEPEWVKTEREQFTEFRDKNKDGKMDKEETRDWILPSDYDHADAEAKHLVYESDADKVRAMNLKWFRIRNAKFSWILLPVLFTEYLGEVELCVKAKNDIISVLIQYLGISLNDCTVWYCNGNRLKEKSAEKLYKSRFRQILMKYWVCF